MREEIVEREIYRKIVYQAYFGRRGQVDRLCAEAFEQGDITIDELFDVVGRVGEHFLDADKLVRDLTQ